MYERPSGIQDVGKFGYIFTKQVDKINNSDNPTLKELCVFYGGQWDERANQACAITNTHLQRNTVSTLIPRVKASADFENCGFYIFLNWINVYLSSQSQLKIEFGFEHRVAESQLCGKTHVRKI